MIVRSLLGSLLCFAIVISLAGKPAPASATVAPHEQFTARQVFEGIFFGEGPATALVPDLWNKNSYAVLNLNHLVGTRRYETGIHAVESQIAHVDPQYLAVFGAAMNSGDPGRVWQAVNRVSKDMQIAKKEFVAQQQRQQRNHALASSLAGDLSDFQNYTQNYNVNYYMTVAAAYGAILIVVLVLVALTIPLLTPSHATAFQKDKYIAYLASRFAGRVASVRS